MTEPSTLKEFTNLKTGRSSVQDYVQKYFPELYNKINNYNNFAKDFKEKAYCYYNQIEKQPKCVVCGKHTHFINYRLGYANHCCQKCKNDDPIIGKNIKNSLIQKHGEDFGKKAMNKMHQTCLEKYGDEYANRIDVVKDKFKQTCQKRYKADSPLQSKEILEKIRQTNINKYDSPYWLSSQNRKDRQQDLLYNMQQTCLKRYGWISATKSDKVKSKISQTIQNKYGVMWACMRNEIHNYDRSDSKPNLYFANLLQQNNIIYTREFSLGRFIYDFKINNILVEIDPFPTHNSTWGIHNDPKSSDYHFQKSKLATENGYRCIHIWDWDNMEKIIQLIKPRDTIYARKCIVKEVKLKECNEYINRYHLQNKCNSQTIRIGLYFNNELVEIMTFGKPRYNKHYEWELLRMCSSKNVVGGSEKIFKYFVNQLHPKSIITYCDNSKFMGKTYEKLGFTLKNVSAPTRHWYNGYIHITDNLLRQRGFDQLFGTNYGKGTDNNELMKKYKFVEIYDSGQTTWVWRNN